MRVQLTPDVSIASLADRQGGVVGRTQLLALGLTRAAIGRRLSNGRLHALYRGVYAVGHRRIGMVGCRWAAVLACGDTAVLGHASAAAAWGYRRDPYRPHVIVPRPARARIPGIVTHSVRTLPADETTTLQGLPITTPARTLLDLAASGLKGRALESALDHAELALELDWAQMATLLERHAGRPGVPSLNATLAQYAPGSVDTRSKLEDIVLELCDHHGIPRPSTNVVIEGKVRDFYWPHANLIVEADSYRWHRSPTALDDDRERDVGLTLAGYTSLRFTWTQCTRRRDYVRRAILRGLRVASAR